MMRNKPLILALAAALTSACTAAPLASPTEVNRAIIEDFARIFYSERDVRQAFEKHVAPDYIQHNPGIADGREAAIRALTPMFSRPEARFEVKRILVDGDLAAIHLLGRGDPATPGAAILPRRARRWPISTAWRMARLSSIGTYCSPCPPSQPIPTRCSERMAQKKGRGPQGPRALFPQDRINGRRRCGGTSPDAFRPDRSRHRRDRHGLPIRSPACR